MLTRFKTYTTQEKVTRCSILALAVVLLVLPLFVTNSYRLYFFSMIGVYIIAASGLDVLVGMSGQMSFGHIAFLAYGGYISVLLSNYTGIPVIICMIIAAFASAGIGMVIAVPCAKLRAQFLVLATIAFSFFTYQLICNLHFLNPYRGLYTEHMVLFGLDLNSDYRYTYYFSFALVAIVLVLKSLLSKSKAGRAMMAVRDNSRSADGMGINVRHYKVLAFAISAFLCGFAGAYMAHLTGFIVSDSFVQPLSFNFVLMIIFGGTNTVFGPVIGAFVYQLLNELLASAQAWRSVLYGVIVLIFIAFLPGGCVAGLRRAGRGLAKLIDKNQAGKETAHNDKS